MRFQKRHNFSSFFNKCEIYLFHVFTDFRRQVPKYAQHISCNFVPGKGSLSSQ